MGDPQVILIGGAPGAGKTTFGQALAGRLGYTTLTVDDLATAIRAVTNPQTHPVFHPATGGHVAYFTDSTPEQLIADAAELQDAMWPVIERVVRIRLIEKAPVVMDWWLLPPEKASAIEVETGPQVASMWLHINEGALEARERALTEFIAPSHDPERMFRNFMSRSLWRNDFIAAQAQTLGLRLIHQPGETPVETLVDEAIGLLGMVR